MARSKSASRTAPRSTPRRAASTGGERGYPRPLLQRDEWTNLNGAWEFTTDPDGQWSLPEQVRFGGQIIVPFAPETPASGVNDTGFYRAAWYRRSFTLPQKLEADQRVVLHFGAVDYSASVWINDELAGGHEGGYTPFWLDITDLLVDDEEQTLVVRAEDDPHDLAKPRGKQDWHLEPHAIWYPRTTGIWQTVWLEIVPATRIQRLKWTPNLERWAFDLTCELAGPHRPGLRLRVRLRHGERLLADDTYSISAGEAQRTITLGDPGIDDARNDLLWSPRSPRLIDADIELLDDTGAVIDSVRSYTALRAVHAQGNQLIFNNRPIQLRMLLDQGYWPESGLTAPDDAALKRDIELVQSMGFNGVRKHQKIEDPRFLYWADRLGLLVWEEMPSPYRFNALAVQRLSGTWLEALERDASHPCIIAWVPFNESWGVPDLTAVAAQRHFVSAIYHLTHTIDPTRPVIGNDGWEMVISDIVAIHDYERIPERLRERYRQDASAVARLFTHERPGHRQLLLGGMSHDGKPIMLTEFGGIAFHKDTQHTWGYKRATTRQQFQQQYTELLATVRSLPLLAGFCYTQFTDTYQEANGLLYMDRTPKLPLDTIKRATSE